MELPTIFACCLSVDDLLNLTPERMSRKHISLQSVTRYEIDQRQEGSKASLPTCKAT